MEQLQELRWFIYLTRLAELSIAFVLAIPIGWDREKETRSMELRTFPLVAVASCAYMLIGRSVVGGDPQALSRLMYGLMTGIPVKTKTAFRLGTCGTSKARPDAPVPSYTKSNPPATSGSTDASCSRAER